ncbi:MAG: hypothetical protein GX177_01595 [Firmicutes bacterium]|jgi:hypothetical protein|nr:hypothetical protein [Bacillota bacterium]
MRPQKWLKLSILLITTALIFAIGWTHGENKRSDDSAAWVEDLLATRDAVRRSRIPAVMDFHWQKFYYQYPIVASWFAEDYSGTMRTWLQADEADAINQLEQMIFKAAGMELNITAVATSEETGAAYDAAVNVLDGSTASMWHTRWNGADRLPQSITLIIDEPTEVNQLTYVPRQDGNLNGVITEYLISYSTDGSEFTELTRGRWSLDTETKIVNFDPVEATHIRLTALQGNGGWASAAEIQLGIRHRNLLPEGMERTLENLLVHYHQIRSERRREILTLVEDRDFEDILFVKRERLPNNELQGHHMVDQYFGHNQIPGGGLYILENAFSENPTLRNVLENSVVVNGPRKGQKLEGGTFISPDLSYCGTKIVFAYTDAKRSKYVWDEETVFHIFSVNIDGSELTQLTFGPYNDFDPVWLPDGDIVFISERRGGFGRCHQRPVPTYTLHRMSPDGSNIRMISYHETNEWNPAVDNNGMIIYTRWDYVDRGATHMHSAWITNPAGEDARALVLNYPIPQRHMSNVGHLRDVPLMQMSMRPIPNSNKIVATAAPHHGQFYGTLIVIDPDVEDDDHTSTFVHITPSTGGFPESGGGSTNYATPYPLSEELFLTVYSPDSGEITKYGIYLLNVKDGKEERALIYLDPAISALDPIPVKPRPVPNAIRVPNMPAAPEEWNVAAHPGVPSSACPTDPGLPLREEAPEAEVFVANVYDTLIPFPEDTKIKELRIWQVYPKSTALADDPMISYESRQSPWAGRNARGLIGTVPVEEDGSAYFKLEPGVPVFFQAVDENGLAVQSMRSVTYVIPGQEYLSCQGCHEPRHTVPANPTSIPQALLREPSEIEIETAPGARPMSFPVLIQPILDDKCVSCHNGTDHRLDLRGIVGQYNWYVSYHNLEPYVFLFDKHYRGNWDQTYPRTEPGIFGARQSRLYQKLATGHGDLTPEELHRFVIWMDSHIAPFFGDYNDVQEQLKRMEVEPVLY